MPRGETFFYFLLSFRLRSEGLLVEEEVLVVVHRIGRGRDARTEKG